jgi:Na+/H+ antiporter NhaC
MASACDHVDHVNTQMPYALVQAGLAAVAFVVAGLLAG